MEMTFEADYAGGDANGSAKLTLTWLFSERIGRWLNLTQASIAATL